MGTKESLQIRQIAAARQVNAALTQLAELTIEARDNAADARDNSALIVRELLPTEEVQS